MDVVCLQPFSLVFNVLLLITKYVYNIHQTLAAFSQQMIHGFTCVIIYNNQYSLS